MSAAHLSSVLSTFILFELITSSSNWSRPIGSNQEVWLVCWGFLSIKSSKRKILESLTINVPQPTILVGGLQFTLWAFAFHFSSLNKSKTKFCWMQPKRLSKCSWNSLVSQKRDFILLNWKDLPSGRHLLVRTIVIILLLHQHHPAPIKSVTNGTESRCSLSLVCVCVICFTTAMSRYFWHPFMITTVIAYVSEYVNKTFQIHTHTPEYPCKCLNNLWTAHPLMTIMWKWDADQLVDVDANCHLSAIIKIV